MKYYRWLPSFHKKSKFANKITFSSSSPPQDIIMPSFSQALSSILLTSALTTWPITTADTTTAHPLFLSDGGRSNHQQRRVGKNSKKQNVVQQCTVEQFVGDYKYDNCQGVETQVRIACDTKKGTKNPCDYQEAPLKNDTDDGCVVQGSLASHTL